MFLIYRLLPLVSFLLAYASCTGGKYYHVPTEFASDEYLTITDIHIFTSGNDSFKGLLHDSNVIAIGGRAKDIDVSWTPIHHMGDLETSYDYTIRLLKDSVLELNADSDKWIAFFEYEDLNFDTVFLRPNKEAKHYKIQLDVQESGKFFFIPNVGGYDIKERGEDRENIKTYLEFLSEKIGSDGDVKVVALAMDFIDKTESYSSASDKDKGLSESSELSASDSNETVPELLEPQNPYLIPAVTAEWVEVNLSNTKIDPKTPRFKWFNKEYDQQKINLHAKFNGWSLELSDKHIKISNPKASSSQSEISTYVGLEGSNLKVIIKNNSPFKVKVNRFGKHKYIFDYENEEEEIDCTIYDEVIIFQENFLGRNETIELTEAICLDRSELISVIGNGIYVLDYLSARVLGQFYSKNEDMRNREEAQTTREKLQVRAYKKRLDEMELKVNQSSNELINSNVQSTNPKTEPAGPGATLKKNKKSKKKQLKKPKTKTLKNPNKVNAPNDKKKASPKKPQKVATKTNKPNNTSKNGQNTQNGDSKTTSLKNSKGASMPKPNNTNTSKNKKKDLSESNNGKGKNVKPTQSYPANKEKNESQNKMESKFEASSSEIKSLSFEEIENNILIAKDFEEGFIDSADELFGDVRDIEKLGSYIDPFEEISARFEKVNIQRRPSRPLDDDDN